MYRLSLERPQDGPAVERLLDQVFGPERRAKQSYAYRQDQAPLAELCRVARGPSGLVGSIRYWPVLIGRTGFPALLLGPLAVDRGLQGSGLGGRLIDETLNLARQHAHQLVILVGEHGYYGRFGFEPAVAHGIHMPGEQDHRLLVRGLAPEGLAMVEGPVFPTSCSPALLATG